MHLPGRHAALTLCLAPSSSSAPGPSTSCWPCSPGPPPVLPFPPPSHPLPPPRTREYFGLLPTHDFLQLRLHSGCRFETGGSLAGRAQRTRQRGGCLQCVVQTCSMAPRPRACLWTSANQVWVMQRKRGRDFLFFYISCSVHLCEGTPRCLASVGAVHIGAPRRPARMLKRILGYLDIISSMLRRAVCTASQLQLCRRAVGLPSGFQAMRTSLHALTHLCRTSDIII